MAKKVSIDDKYYDLLMNQALRYDCSMQQQMEKLIDRERSYLEDEDYRHMLQERVDKLRAERGMK